MNSKKTLAPVNDINLKIFDEICEERFAALDLDALLVSIIDNVPADALPHLAEQYHITGNEGWLQALSETEKRNLIKSSIKMHRYKGTKYALEEIFKTRGMHEFKKVEFAQMVKNHIKTDADISPEIINIIDELRNLNAKVTEFKEK